MSANDTPSARIEKGTCYLLFAHDVGDWINLDACEKRIQSATERLKLRRSRRAPRYFDYDPPPLRVVQELAPMKLGSFQTASTLDIVIYDFGAVSVAYQIPLACGFEEILSLGRAPEELDPFIEDARRRVAELVRVLGPAVAKPTLADWSEEYAIYQIERWDGPSAPAEILERFGSAIARILRSEPRALSKQEADDALACRISYGPGDLTVIDWDGAMIFDTEADDVRAVLDFANAELLEMRYLDSSLDTALDKSYDVLGTSRSLWARLRAPSANLRRVAQMQVDGALLFERVNNALKLLGDQYLARVYRLASQRMHLAEWDASILRKLDTLDHIYESLSDQAAARRVEVLEWIIIILIAFEIAWSFLGKG